MVECPKTLLVEVDLAKAEWVVSAHAAQESAMIEAIQSGRDIHLSTGAMISGAPDAYILEEDHELGHTTSPEELAAGRTRLGMDKDWFAPRTMTIRQAGKRCNHGLNYGMRADRFSLTTGTPPEDAKRMVSLYHTAYPGLRKWHRRVEEQLHKDRTLRNAFGHKRSFRDRFSNDLVLQAIAWEPQSTIATVTNRGLTRIYQSESLRRVFEPLAQVHDSIAGQARPGTWLDLLCIGVALDHLMEEPITLHGADFVVKRDLKIGPNWRDMEPVDLDEGVAGLEKAWSACRKLD